MTLDYHSFTKSISGIKSAMNVFSLIIYFINQHSGLQRKKLMAYTYFFPVSKSRDEFVAFMVSYVKDNTV